MTKDRKLGSVRRIKPRLLEHRCWNCDRLHNITYNRIIRSTDLLCIICRLYYKTKDTSA